MIKIRKRFAFDKDMWLKLLFASCIAISIFGELKADSSMALYKVAAFIDNLKLKYILEVVAIAAGLFVCYKSPAKRKLSNINMLYETKNMLFAIGVMGLITVVMQFFNGFYSYSYLELFQWICPLLFVFAMVNVFDDFEFCFDLAFYMTVILYVYYMGNKFTISNFKLISFADSNSPFEGIFAFYTCIMIGYFLYTNKRVKAFICLLVTVLSFKRIALITVILMFAFYKFIPRRKRVSPVLINIAKIVFIIIPIVLTIICNYEFAEWLYDTFAINIYELTLGRFEMISVLVESDNLVYGLGSTIKVLDVEYSDRIMEGVANHVSVHNDILRIYLDTTIVGTVAFTCCSFNAAKKCYASFFLMLYMLTDMIFNHLTASGSVTMWILVYMSIYYFNNESAMAADNNIFDKPRIIFGPR